MKQNYLHDQRGVAMLLELVLVAVVLALVGVAVYQSSRHASAPAASVSTKPVVTAAVGLADSAAAITEISANADSTLSASTEAIAGEVTDTDVDVSNLGGSTSEDSY